MRAQLSRLLIPVLFSAVLAACSSAGSSGPTITIVEPWARPAAAGGQSAAYFTITNTANTADALMSASSPAAGMVEVHETSIDGTGMSAMHAVDRVAIPAGESVVLKPGSYHVMLMGLTSELTVGTTVRLDLVFERAGKVVVQAEIRQV